MPVKIVPWEIIGDRLHELAKQGLVNHEIAMVLSREFNVLVTRNAVIGRLRRTNIAKRSAGTIHQRREIRLAQPKPVKPVSFMQLKDHHCRWPVDTAKGVCYCGKQKIAGSYCEEHSQRAHHASQHQRVISGRHQGLKNARQKEGNQVPSQNPQDPRGVQTGDATQRLEEGPEGQETLSSSGDRT